MKGIVFGDSERSQHIKVLDCKLYGMSSVSASHMKEGQTDSHKFSFDLHMGTMTITKKRQGVEIKFVFIYFSTKETLGPDNLLVNSINHLYNLIKELTIPILDKFFLNACFTRSAYFDLKENQMQARHGGSHL